MEPEDDYDDNHPDDEPYGHAMGRGGNGDQMNDAAGADDAVLDLAELEQLQEEAERMKGLGNKHMAAQVSNITIVPRVLSGSAGGRGRISVHTHAKRIKYLPPLMAKNSNRFCAYLVPLRPMTRLIE